MPPLPQPQPLLFLGHRCQSTGCVRHGGLSACTRDVRRPLLATQSRAATRQLALAWAVRRRWQAAPAEEQFQPLAERQGLQARAPAESAIWETAHSLEPRLKTRLAHPKRWWEELLPPGSVKPPRATKRDLGRHSGRARALPRARSSRGTAKEGHFASYCSCGRSSSRSVAQPREE